MTEEFNSVVSILETTEADEHVSVKRSMVESALGYIHMQVAIQQGVYHDQDSIVEDMQKLVDEGRLPAVWYDLKSELDSSGE